MVRRFLKEKRYGRKVLTGLLAAATILGSLCMNTLASASNQMPDLAGSQAGNLTVKFTMTVDNEESKTELFGMQIKTGAKIELYKVADLEVSGGAAKYTLTSNFRSLASSVKFEGMNASQSSVAAATLKKYVESNNISGKSAVTDSNSTVVFHNLEPGMYLIFRPDSDITKTDEDQNIFSPFLVSVPIRQVDSGVNEWNYSVEAFPKLSDRNGYLESEPTTESETPDSEKPTPPTEPDNPSPSGGKESTNPIKTGDDTNVYLWRWLLLTSMVVIMTTFVVKRKKEK